jgi:Tfp pilus assembly protein PilV
MSLIEVTVAMFVIATALFGFSQLTGSVLVGTMKSRVRQSAVALANQQIEVVRGSTYSDVMMRAGTNPAPPATFTDDAANVFTTAATLKSDGTKVNLLTAASAAACPNCLVYEQTPAASTTGNHAYTLRTAVVAVDDPADGLSGGSPSDTSPVDYKKVIIQVISATPAFTYTAQTIVHDATNDPVTAVQGVQIEVRDGNSDTRPDNDWDSDPTTTNDVVADDQYDWVVSIPEAGVEGAEMQEGTYSNFNLEPGVYNVTIQNTATTTDWYPSGSPTGASDSFTCTVTAGSVSTCSRTWLQRDECLPGVGTGKLWAKALRLDPLLPDGFPLQNVDLTLNALDPLAPYTNTQKTGANGEYIWDATLPVGPYSVTASILGYQTVTQLTCVTAQDPESPHLTFTMALNPVGSTTPANVTLTYTGGGNQTFVINLVGAQTYEQQQSVNKKASKVYAFNALPGVYTVSVSCLKKGVPNLKDTKLNQTLILGSTYSTTFTIDRC